MQSDPKNRDTGKVAIIVAILLMFLYLLLFVSMAIKPISPRTTFTLPVFELCYIPPACESYAYTDEEIAFLLLRKWESLSYSSYYDINAYRNGWGTPAKNPGEIINLSQANERSLAIFDQVRADIADRYPALSTWQQLVLSVMDYNVSRFGPKLEKAIASGDTEQIASVMQLYVNAGGKPLRGLELRRAEEAKFLLLSPHERQAAAVELQRTVNEHIRTA